MKLEDISYDAMLEGVVGSGSADIYETSAWLDRGGVPYDWAIIDSYEEGESPKPIINPVNTSASQGNIISVGSVYYNKRFDECFIVTNVLSYETSVYVVYTDGSAGLYPKEDILADCVLLKSTIDT